jgi:hypothetical protein
MPAYCALCKRPFTTQTALDQHKRHSSAHRKPPQAPSQAQDLTQPPQIPKKQKYATHSLVKAVKSLQVVDGGVRIHVSTKGKHGRPQNAIASSSSMHQTVKPVETVPQASQSQWSVIPQSGYTKVLNALSEHCHSAKELKENGFTLDLYHPLYYVNSKICKRCNSKSSTSIMALS